MADFGEIGGFDASKVEPNKAMDVLPPGDYDIIIIKSELKPTKALTGKLLELEMQIINGPAQNRKLWDRLNIVNPNAMAQQIALGTLSAICRAVNVLTPKDSAELHMKPLKAKVIVGKDDKGNPRNEVKGYSPRLTGPQAAAPPATAGYAPATAMAGSHPVGSTPWG